MHQALLIGPPRIVLPIHRYCGDGVNIAARNAGLSTDALPLGGIFPYIARLMGAQKEIEVKDARSAPPDSAFTRVDALMGGDPSGRP